MVSSVNNLTVDDKPTAMSFI